MSRGVSQRKTAQTLSAAEVEDFLCHHTDFFRDHLDLLEVLKIPHPSGEAVSLVSRQIDVLRGKNERLLRQLDDLVQIARDNDALHQRVHQLTLTLMDANSVEDLLASLDWGLHQYFQADFAAVRIARPALISPVADLSIAPSSPGMALCDAVLDSGKPRCGQPEPDHAAFLFGNDADAVASYALLPLQHAGFSGLFAIGSRDPGRFRSDMGFALLSPLSEILAARLVALLHGGG
jgi:hypothetical protein